MAGDVVLTIPHLRAWLLEELMKEAQTREIAPRGPNALRAAENHDNFTLERSLVVAIFVLRTRAVTCEEHDFAPRDFIV